jgi:hypothetical protein
MVCTGSDALRRNQLEVYEGYQSVLKKIDQILRSSASPAGRQAGRQAGRLMLYNSPLVIQYILGITALFII